MSAEIIELDDVDGLGTGAVGEPGQRAFYIQARTERDAAHRAGREGAGRAARGRGGRVPRQASPTTTRSSRSSSRRRRARCTSRPSRCSAPGSSASGSTPSASSCCIELRERCRRRRRERRRRPTSTTPPTTRATSRGSTPRARRCGPWRRAARRRSQVGDRRARCANSRWTRPGTRVLAGTDARRARRALDAAELEVVGRMRYSSNATFLVEAKIDGMRAGGDLQAASRRTAVVGLPPGHAVPTRGRGVRAVATRSGWGIVPRHDPARRPARHRRGAAIRRPRSRRALLHPARRARRPLPRVRRVRRAAQQHRPQGRPLPPRRGERRHRRHRPRPHVPRRRGSCAR